MTLLTFKTSFYRSGFPAHVTSALKVRYFNKVVFLSMFFCTFLRTAEVFKLCFNKLSENNIKKSMHYEVESSTLIDGHVAQSFPP